MMSDAKQFPKVFDEPHKVIRRWIFAGIPQVDLEFEDGTYESFNESTYNAWKESDENHNH